VRDESRYYADRANNFADAPVAVDGERGYVAFEPLGVVLAVMPWNFPLWQVIRFAAPRWRRATSDCSSTRPTFRSALALEQLFADAGRRRRLSNIAHRGRPGQCSLATASRGHLTEAGGGASVASAVDGVKKTVLELGGSDPFIVMEAR
jgi:succinate-semialdehyde dehydrogenase/glutarate-semialdehyde dehydrogenase